MDTTWILIFVGIIAVISVIGFLLKSFAKIIILLGVIYLLFHLGFIWGVDDLNEKLHLDKFLKKEANEQVQEKYESFSDKREQNGVVETKLVSKTINDSIELAKKKAMDEVGKIDKQQLISDLQTKLKSFDKEAVNKALAELKAELAKYNVTPEDVQSDVKS